MELAREWTSGLSVKGLREHTQSSDWAGLGEAPPPPLLSSRVVLTLPAGDPTLRTTDVVPLAWQLLGPLMSGCYNDDRKYCVQEAGSPKALEIFGSMSILLLSTQK